MQVTFLRHICSWNFRWLGACGWEGLGDSVWDFGNEGVVFDEGIIGEQLSAIDVEPDERQ